LSRGDPVQRMAAVLVTPAVRAAAPPGVDPGEFGLAVIEDACDLVAELELVTPAIAVSRAARQQFGEREVAELAWPGTAVLQLGHADGAGLGLVDQTLRSLAALGAVQGVVLAADAPDLPILLIGKLLRALGGQPRRVDVAVCPADGGGLVALAAWLPVADWLAGIVPAQDLADGTLEDGALADGALAGGALADGTVELDLADAVDRLRRAAPRRGAVQVVPGWHRLRSPADVGRLDPGLEGWSATRGLLRPG
jgi:hypothetical protein